MSEWLKFFVFLFIYRNSLSKDLLNCSVYWKLFGHFSYKNSDQIKKKHTELN